jgi:hypothetical protein
MPKQKSPQPIFGVRSVAATFREGDRVVMARGTYQGTPGVFLHLKADAKWADITEPNGSVRCHPVEWMEHSA